MTKVLSFRLNRSLLPVILVMTLIREVFLFMATVTGRMACKRACEDIQSLMFVSCILIIGFIMQSKRWNKWVFILV